MRSVRDGYVFGAASPLHMGRLTQVWQVRSTDQQDRLVCVSRVKMAIWDNFFSPEEKPDK